MKPKANVVVSCVAKRTCRHCQPEDDAFDNIIYLFKDSQAVNNAVFVKLEVLP